MRVGTGGARVLLLVGLQAAYALVSDSICSEWQASLVSSGEAFPERLGSCRSLAPGS